MLFVRVSAALLLVTVGCGHSSDNAGPDASTTPDGMRQGPAPCSGSRTDCATAWEQAASDKFDGLLPDPTGLAAFLKDMPKGGDLHNHLTGAVYAETYLGWAHSDGDCVNTSSYSAVNSGSCSTSNVAVPTSGALYDSIVRAWSMKDFVAGAENGHDHFFATFGKYGLVPGTHRDQTIADVATRAADENEGYVETMLNLGKNTGTLSSTVWTSSTLTAADLPTLYSQLTSNAGFANAITQDTAVVNSAATGWRNVLGCNAAMAPDACNVTVRFIAQVSRTGANDQIFGQLVSAFEMASRTNQIVALNLSSPEDNSASITNYDLHMAMLDFLHTKYAGTSPLHVTLHAGELTAAYLPANSTANTYHIKAAVEIGHAERIGHGIDIASETGSADIMAEMAANHVLVEACLSSNTQILGISGAAHPLASYLAAGVPVALATDDQGVSRSSMAGEYQRAALDQHLTYRQLKTLARNSLDHAFAPGASLWTTVGTPLAACAATDTMALGDTPNATCAAFLATSERATLQWDLENRFLTFESQQ